MHHVRQQDLPFVGSSHQFVGAEQGDTVFQCSCSWEARFGTRSSSSSV